jgi:hypothetical protein
VTRCAVSHGYSPSTVFQHGLQPQGLAHARSMRMSRVLWQKQGLAQALDLQRNASYAPGNTLHLLRHVSMCHIGSSCSRTALSMGRLRSSDGCRSDTSSLRAGQDSLVRQVSVCAGCGPCQHWSVLPTQCVSTATFQAHKACALCFFAWHRCPSNAVCPTPAASACVAPVVACKLPKQCCQHLPHCFNK